MKRIVLLMVVSFWLPDCSAMELPSKLSGQGQAKIRFDCTSTLHDFTGQVLSEPFTWHILPDPNSGLPIVRVELEVVVDKMDTHITFTLDAALSLKQFGLKPPTVFGIIRVNGHGLDHRRPRL